MTSFSGCFFLVSMVVSLPFLLASSSTLSTKYIDTICNNSKNKTFCLQTLTTYPPAVSETNMFKLVKIVLSLGESHANKTAAFVTKLEKEPTFKRHFAACNQSYTRIVVNLGYAIEEIDDIPLGPGGAYNDVILCFDETAIVKNEVSNNTDNASKTLMGMTIIMDAFIDIGLGAINTVKNSNY